MRVILFSLSMILVGCGTVPADRSPDQTYHVIDLGPNFKRFWSRASGQPFSLQLKAWEEEIENPNQTIYDALVWQKKFNPNWKAGRDKSLKKRFAQYEKHAAEIQRAFDAFRGTLERQIAVFQKTFADARFTHDILGMPSPGFDGKTGDVPDSTGKLHPTLAFGIDALALNHTNLNSLFAHELFHLYQLQKLGENEDSLTARSQLTFPLWCEGLATYVSEKMNPGIAPADFLGPAAKGKVEQLPEIAKRFLQDANEKAFDEKKPKIYESWFYGSEGINKDWPSPLGYFLGYHVVRRLAKAHTVAEMATWPPEKVHSKVVQILKEISAGS